MENIQKIRQLQERKRDVIRLRECGEVVNEKGELLIQELICINSELVLLSLENKQK